MTPTREPDITPDAGITLTITLTHKMAGMLSSNASPNFFADQADRFEVLSGPESPLPTDPMFANGTMQWCESMSDMLLLRAYEQACGRNQQADRKLAGCRQQRIDAARGR